MQKHSYANNCWILFYVQINMYCVGLTVRKEDLQLENDCFQLLSEIDVCMNKACVMAVKNTLPSMPIF